VGQFWKGALEIEWNPLRIYSSPTVSGCSPDFFPTTRRYPLIGDACPHIESSRSHTHDIFDIPRSPLQVETELMRENNRRIWMRDTVSPTGYWPRYPLARNALSNPDNISYITRLDSQLAKEIMRKSHFNVFLFASLSTEISLCQLIV
jgi:hypothetical protein